MDIIRTSSTRTVSESESQDSSERETVHTVHVHFPFDV